LRALRANAGDAPERQHARPTVLPKRFIGTRGAALVAERNPGGAGRQDDIVAKIDPPRLS
jgi:hypothetical protein